MNIKITNFIITILYILSALYINAEDQWPSLRGSNKGEASKEFKSNLDLKEWHFVYKNTRRYKTGMAVWASPSLAIIGGHPMAFIGGFDQSLNAMDLFEKKIIWRKLTNGAIESAPVIGRVDGVDVVFFTSSDRTLYAHVAFNGRKVWTKELIKPGSTLGDSKLSSPLLFNNKLYVTAFSYDKSLPSNKQEGYLFCLNKSNGTLIWKLKVSNGFISSPQGYTIGEKKYVVIASRKGIVQCFDVTDKNNRKQISTVWKYQMPHEVMGSPVVLESKNTAYVYLGSKYGNITAINGTNGKKLWQRMAGNWIDNTLCIGKVNDKDLVFAGSHDYKMYAFEAHTGEIIWSKALGGEIYSAPVFFHLNGKPALVTASLDNHLYLLSAHDGEVITSFFTGAPVWDKISKGENLWGSPAVLQAGNNSLAVHGSYNGVIYSLPLAKEASLTAMARSSKELWMGLIIILVLFGGIVLPFVVLWPEKKR